MRSATLVFCYRGCYNGFDNCKKLTGIFDNRLYTVHDLWQNKFCSIVGGRAKHLHQYTADHLSVNQYSDK